MTATTTFRRPKDANPVHIAPLFRWLLLAALVGGCGLLFVYLKNQQHFIGGQTRLIERDIREMRSRNDALLAQITTLSSYPELRKKLAQNGSPLVDIGDNIARLTPAPAAQRAGGIRTAANGRILP